MTINHKPTGIALSFPKGLAISAIVSFLTTLVLTSIIAYLIDKEIINESSVGYAIMVMLILTSYTGSMIAWIKIKHRRLMVCVAAGGIYYCLLLSITALFFGGQYQAIGETALLVLCGSLLATMSGIKRRNKIQVRKFKVGYR